MGRTPGQGTPGCGDGEVGGTRVGGPGMEGTGVGVAMGPPHPLYLPPPTPEPSDRDLSCLLASLVQLLADPHARSLRGFQSLVQREWVAAGHPFPQRLGLRRDSPREEVTTPNPSAVSPPRGRRPHLTSLGVTPVRLPPPAVPRLLAVLGLHLAAAAAVPGGVWLHRGVPAGPARQRLPALLQHLPLQLPATAGPRRGGERGGPP